MKVLTISHVSEGINLLHKLGTYHAKNMPSFLQDLPRDIQREEAKDLIRIARLKNSNHYLISSKRDSKIRRTKSLRPRARALFGSNLCRYQGFYSHIGDREDIMKKTKLKLVFNNDNFFNEVYEEDEVDIFIREQELLENIPLKSIEIPQTEPLIIIETISPVIKVETIFNPIKEELEQKVEQLAIETEELVVVQPIIDLIKEQPLLQPKPIIKPSKKSRQHKASQNRAKNNLKRKGKAQKERAEAEKFKQEFSKRFSDTEIINLNNISMNKQKDPRITNRIDSERIAQETNALLWILEDWFSG